MLSENKKDIHGLFHIVENNKRSCMFCEWSTVRNLTRMRTHIVMHCANVPEKVRSCFLKQEYKDYQNGQEEETYQVFEVDEQERDWEESTTVELVNDDGDEEEDEQADDSEINYVEVQELEERQCSWCGSVISYDSCEVEDGSEVYCSTECFKAQTECMPDDEVVTVKRITKRAAPKTPSPAPESPPKAKKIKVLMVTSADPAPKTTTVSLKKEPEVTPVRLRRSNPTKPTPPQKHQQEDEEFNYTVEEEVTPEVKPPKVTAPKPAQKKVVAAAELPMPKQQQQPKAKLQPTITTMMAKKSVPAQTATVAATTASKLAETTATATKKTTTSTPVPVKISKVSDYENANSSLTRNIEI